VTPSFKTEIDHNPLKIFDGYVEKTKEIEKNIIECLKKGGPDNPIIEDKYSKDIFACSDIEKLQSEILGLENYEIMPISPKDDKQLPPPNEQISIPTKNYYTLLFDVTDVSLNPYSNVEVTVKLAIELLDDIPPPATEIITYNDNWPAYDGITDSLYLRWNLNPASDVLAYFIYYKKIEKTLDGQEIPSSPPSDISKMDNYVPEQKTRYSNIDNLMEITGIQEPIKPSLSSTEVIWAPATEWKIDSSLEGDYYLVIVAKDRFLNKAVEITPKKVHIPNKEEIEQFKKKSNNLCGFLSID